MESDLKITVEKPATWARRLTITVPAETVQRERETTTRRLAGRIRLPGFRQGKVPRNVIEKRFGQAIEQEMIERLIGEAYKEAIRRENLQPITQGAIDHIHYHSGEDLTFHVDLEVRPEIALERIGGFTLNRQPAEVTDDALNQVLDRLREQNADWNPIGEETPLIGDMTVVEITPQDGEAAGTTRRYQLFLGEGQARPEIEELVRLLKPGEEREFEVDLPEDAEDTSGEVRKHKLRIKLVEAKRPQLPEVDDEFAKKVGSFESADALKTAIRDDLEKEAGVEADRGVRQQLLDRIIEANPFEVPGSMVDRYLEQVLRIREGEENEQVRQLREAARPAAEQALRRMLVVEEIAEKEGLRPTAEDVNARLAELAARNNREPSEIRAQLKKDNRLGELEDQLTEEKVFEYLLSLSTIE